jgi:hypothetical protein
LLSLLLPSLRAGLLHHSPFLLLASLSDAGGSLSTQTSWNDDEEAELRALFAEFDANKDNFLERKCVLCQFCAV